MSEKPAPKLLSGGNPQIPMGYGDEPVQDYIAAMPGWKNAFGSRIDELIESAVPGVEKAIKWNSPFYGMKKDWWFLSYHCFDKYIKVSFLQGTSLEPTPPVSSKVENVRYLHISETDFDENQFVAWVKQASELPGVKM